jgi:hypothetical protein
VKKKATSPAANNRGQNDAIPFASAGARHSLRAQSGEEDVPTDQPDPDPTAALHAGELVLGDAPAFSLGALYTATAQAMAIAGHNAAAAQQQGFVTAQAAAVAGVTTLYAIAAATDAAVARTLFDA